MSDAEQEPEHRPSSGSVDGPTPRAAVAEQRYLEESSARIRTGRLGALLRTGGIQAVWMVVIVAGAGVPLSEALGGDPRVASVLGFVVVVAAGVERIFSRTTPAAVAQDAMRRSLAGEQRAYLARVAPYEQADAFDRFVARSEQIIATYDQTMLEYSSSLARQGE